MYKIEKQNEISWPVTVNIPRDGGNTVKATFTGKFRILSGAEFNGIFAKEGGNDEDLCRAMFVGWGDDLCDESGAPLVFTEEERNKFISVPYQRMGVVEAYMQLSHGKKAAAKN